MEVVEVSHIPKVFEFCEKPLQFDLNDVQRETISPVTFQQIGADEIHSKLSSMNVLQTARGITAILPEHSIKTLIEGFVCRITFVSVHDTPDLVSF